MALWFALAALLGTLTTLAYALLAYVILKKNILVAGITGAAATVATFSAISVAIEPKDAGALLLELSLVLTCFVVGAPLGTLLLRLSIENIQLDE
jgi:hypothetical protein